MILIAIETMPKLHCKEMAFIEIKNEICDDKQDIYNNNDDKISNH